MTTRLAIFVMFSVLLCAREGSAQPPSEIAHITDDPRCATALHGIADDEAALRTGCARYWPVWPKTRDPLREGRISALQSIWYAAQLNGLGHYASTPAEEFSKASAAPTAPADNVSVRTGNSATSIRGRCATEWPDDFQMRAFCEKQQNEALATLDGRSMNDGERRTIRDKCARDWPDDYKMQTFCEEQQLKALDSLR
jgi:hypothetical protein